MGFLRLINSIRTIVFNIKYIQAHYLPHTTSSEGLADSCRGI
jgi:hypothetical protein